MCAQKKAKITIVKNGPYFVTGNVPLAEKIISPKGKSYEYKEGKPIPQKENCALCRCGHTKNRPFCDGAHQRADFQGIETASREPYIDRAEHFIGPELEVLDDHRCALGMFCHREPGSIWELVSKSDIPEYKQEIIKSAAECPAGRLVVRDKQGNIIEMQYEQEIEILQDIEKAVSGPLYVKGGIPLIAADGYTYEIRNQMALCRCGQSKNKPFCDAAHVVVKYRDDEGIR